MRKFLIGFIVGLTGFVSGAISAQAPYGDIEPRIVPRLMTTDANSPTGLRPVILIDKDSEIPQGYIHVAVLIGRKAGCVEPVGCEFPIKVFAIK